MTAELAYHAAHSMQPPGARVDLDRALRALRVGSKIVHLAPRSFVVLSYLYDHQNRVVSKSELLRELWPPGGSEHALRQEIYSLRRQLAANGLAECVVTVSQYGYHFQSEPLTASAQRERPRLSEFHQRALAATAHFQQKADTHSWGRALFWYEQLASARPVLNDVHLGAVGAAMRLALRSAIPPDEALRLIDKHLRESSRSQFLLRREITLAMVSGLFEGNVGRAILRLAELALSGSPDDELEQMRAFHFLARGDATNALASQRTAIEIAPQTIETHLNYGFMLLMANLVGEGERQFKFIRQLQPENGDAVEGHALALLAQRKTAESLDVLSATSSARAVAMKCVAQAVSGDERGARDRLAELNDLRRGTYVSPLLLARCNVALGNMREALRLIGQASKEPARHWFDLENRLWLLSFHSGALT